LERYLWLVLIVAALGGMWLMVKRLHESGPKAESTAAPTVKNPSPKHFSAGPKPTPATPEARPMETVEVTTRQAAAPTNPAGGRPLLCRPVAAAAPAAPRPEPSAYTRQLVTGSTQLDLRSGAITPEQAGQWKEGLQQLAQQGAAAVLAVAEFLERNQDLRFDRIKDGTLAGYPSLLAGLLDALRQIGGPERMELSLQTLRKTADPLEIAWRARNLEQRSPGQNRQDMLDAARAILAQAGPGPAPRRREKVRQSTLA